MIRVFERSRGKSNYREGSAKVASVFAAFLLFGVWVLEIPAQDLRGQSVAQVLESSYEEESAWEALKRRQPEIVEDRSISTLERKILQALTAEQLDDFLYGVDLESIFLENEERLSSFIESLEEEEAAGMVFKPVAACRIADTRETGAKLTAGETRGLLVRDPETDYSLQGGAATGCGLPGLKGETLRTNIARALFLKVELSDIEGQGEFVIWPANDHPRPSVSLLDYSQGQESTSGVYIVPMCDEYHADPCRAGDLDVQSRGAGAHFTVSVLGYFESASTADSAGTLWNQVGVNIHNVNAGGVGVGTSNPRGKLHTRGTSTLEFALEAVTGNPDFSLAENGNVKAQVKYLIADNGLGFLTDESHSGFGGLATNTTKLFISGTTDNVGIGILDPNSRLAVGGTVESTTGGFKFPDGTLQTSAADGDADTLDGFDSTDFLLAAGGDLALTGVLQTGAATVTVPYNRHGTVVTTHSLNDANDLMVSDDLEVNDQLYVGDNLVVEDDIQVGASILFNNATERFEWDAAQTRFELGDELSILNVLRVGNNGAAPVSYSAFGGTANPGSGDMSNDSDVYIQDDLEIGSQLYLSGELRMDTEEGDQEIYFFEDGSPTAEFLNWDDSEDHLAWSDDLAVAGTLQVGSTASALGYNRFGSAAPLSGIISASDDVLISGDLEVARDLEVNDDLEVVDNLTVGDQLFVGSGSSTDSDTIFFDGSERVEWDESQSRFELTDELAVVGVIRVGNIGAAPVNFSVFGDSADPASGDITDDEDVFIGENLEVGETLYLNGELRMGLEESDQSIFFFDEGSQITNRFYWDDSTDQFRLTDTLTIDGTLNANSKNFKIDHPLDPRDKYLYHTSVESPDMMTVYNGNVTTDDQGEAVVELPAYFEALNRDYRYQLTSIGVFAQAIVAEEIADNKFVVKTSQPYVKVSWQVTGIRQDAWANEHRVVPEVMKPRHERGTLLRDLQRP